ncbi:MAG: penicillin acylase family protein [Candidatus Aminicenantales bacterium]
MKIFKRILSGLAALVLVAAAGAFFYGRHLARRALPDYSADVRLAGLKADVTVYRDEFAVPHIFAGNEDDLYRATGYVMAQDRLWQMDLIRRATAGRLSEIFGQKLIDTDLFMRLLRIPDKSRRALAQTAPPMVRALEAFADGVNQCLAALGKKLPLEFALLGYAPEPWLPEHTLNLIGYMAWMGADTTAEDRFLDEAGRKLGFDSEKFKELLPHPELYKTVIHPDFKPDPGRLRAASIIGGARTQLRALGLSISAASNNWAVSGARSVTGKPLLANDMHLDYGLPGIWYQIHQVAEGSLDVTGVTIPGSPFIVAGHNDRIAWGYTFVEPDALDLYRETVDSAPPGRYRFNGAWHPLEIRRETIRIKGCSEAVRTVRSTPHGPIISSEADFARGEALAMRWVGLDDSNESRAAYEMNRARNWKEFTAALRNFAAVAVNTIYADVDGNIGLYTCGSIPIRRKGDGLGVLPGDSDEYDWTGRVPFEALPHTFNPPGGAVFSANNKPAGDDYPYSIGHYFTRERVDRIRELLAEKPRFGIDDFIRMQADLKSRRAESLGRIFSGLLDRAADLGPDERRALGLMKAWDAEFRADSPAATVFETLYLELIREAVGDELGPELLGAFLNTIARPLLAYLVDHPDSPWWDDVRTPDKRETFPDILRRSFAAAVLRLEKELGNDPAGWTWGRVHTLTLSHPLSQVRVLDLLFHLNRGPFPLGGNFDTLPQQHYAMDGDFKVLMGPSQRHIFDAADWDRSLTVIPTGESGLPGGPHYGDQTDLFLRGRYHADYVARDRIEATARYRATLRPRE